MSSCLRSRILNQCIIHNIQASMCVIFWLIKDMMNIDHKLEHHIQFEQFGTVVCSAVFLLADQCVHIIQSLSIASNHAFAYVYCIVRCAERAFLDEQHIYTCMCISVGVVIGVRYCTQTSAFIHVTIVDDDDLIPMSMIASHDANVCWTLCAISFMFSMFCRILEIIAVQPWPTNVFESHFFDYSCESMWAIMTWSNIGMMRSTETRYQLTLVTIVVWLLSSEVARRTYAVPVLFPVMAANILQRCVWSACSARRRCALRLGPEVLPPTLTCGTFGVWCDSTQRVR